MNRVRVGLKGIISVMAVGILALVAFAACASYENITVAHYLRDRGLDPHKEQQILSLEKVQGNVGKFGFFFLGGEGSFKPGTALGFAVSTGNGGVSIIEVPYSKINFVMSDNSFMPAVKFTLDEPTRWRKGVNDNSSIWKAPPEIASFDRQDTVSSFQGLSTSEILEKHLRSVTITLSPEIFQGEITPLRFSQSGDMSR